MDIASFFQNNPTVGLILYIGVFAAIFYFILIRPQKKKDKQYKDLLASIEIGDKVTTIGGFYGTVTKIKEDKIEFEIGTNEKTTMFIYKWGIKDITKKEQA